LAQCQQSRFQHYRCIQTTQQTYSFLPRFSNAVPLLKFLHWLHVQSHIIFKLCSIAYQTLSSEEPSYLFSMLSLTPKPREFRSSVFFTSVCSQGKIQAGTRVIFSCRAYFWNSLPEHVKSSNSIVSFRHHLKTHHFQSSLSLLCFLSFHSIRLFVDEICIVPRL